MSTICYISKGDKTLLLYRNKKKNDVHEGFWLGLGGEIERGESVEECAKRVVFEKTGFRISNMRMCGVVSSSSFYVDEEWLMFLFSCGDFTGELIDSNEGTLEWVETDKMMELPMWEGDYVYLDWMKQNKFFSANMVHKDKKLISHEVIFYGN